jgi:polyisoprenoid-binding protein YceI
MKKLLYTFAIGATMMLSAFTAYTSMNWKIADGYSIKFSSNDPSGVFTYMKGDIVFDTASLGTSKFDITIDASSINTGNGMKNGNAKSANWFDANKYPDIKFTSSKITKTATGYKASGTLDLHGVKNSLTIPFTFSKNTFNGSFTINRTDYKIGQAGGDAAEEFKVDVSVPVKQ